MKEFYSLQDPINLPDNKYVDLSVKVDWESIKCPKYNGHMRAGNRITDLFVEVPNNTNDVLWTFLSDCLVNNKVVSLLKSLKISGYELKDVIIEKDKRKHLKYENVLYELIITGDGGHIRSNSGYKIVEICNACGSKKVQDYTNGILVDKKAWDGSDIFTVREYPKYILVTKKVKNLFEENKVTGCEFVPAEQLKSLQQQQEEKV